MGFLPSRRATAPSAAQKMKKQLMDYSLSKYQVIQLDSVYGLDENEFDPYLAMALNCTWSNFDDQTSPNRACKLLAVASEKGLVSIYRSRFHRQGYLATDEKVATWQAHHNAIFDIKWRPNSANQLLTTSGDLSLRLWDLNSYSACPNSIWSNEFKPIAHFCQAHLSTIKSSSFCDENLIATGARDGHIKLWDIRSSISLVREILDAHKVNPLGSKKHRRGRANVVHRSSPLSSITCVLFKPRTFTLYSCSAGDPIIKEWDIRMIKNCDATSGRNKAASQIKSPSVPAKRVANTPTGQFSPSSNLTAGHGYSCLTLDSLNRLYAARCDHTIYAFDCTSNKLIGTFSSPKYRSSSGNMSQIRVVNDHWLVAGSISNCTPIWSLDFLSKVSNEGEPPIKVSPRMVLNHLDEVTCLEVDDESYELYTCCPESINKWTLLQPTINSKVNRFNGLGS